MNGEPLASTGSISNERWSAAARLLAQLVARCDLLQMDATDCGSSLLAGRLAQISRLSMGASRQSCSTDDSSQAVEHLQTTVGRILVLVDEVQQLSATSPGILRGEDLLSLQVAALELKAIAVPNGHAAIAFTRGAADRDPEPPSAKIMIVDDDEGNREILARLLRSEPWQLRLAASGVEALALAQAEDFDLIMLDVLMPGMDGLALLRRFRHDDRLNQIPVIMISGVDQTASVVACLEMGAADYVSKPFNPVLLRARIHTALEHRRMVLREKQRTQELQEAMVELDSARRQQEKLIQSMLPPWATQELRANGSVAPRYHNDVTVLFTDFAGFTASCSALTAYELVGALNEYFTAFDDILARYGLERLKTVGDAYMCVAGLHADRPSHPNDAVLAAFEMLAFAQRRSPEGLHWQMRVGINTGPVVSGVVGNQRLAFDIWGDTVNIASRVVAAGCPGCINISENTFQRVKELFACRSRGELPIKGKRSMEMFFVEGSAISVPDLAASEQEHKFQERYRSYFGYPLPSLPPSLFQLAPALPASAGVRP